MKINNFSEISNGTILKTFGYVFIFKGVDNNNNVKYHCALDIDEYMFDDEDKFYISDGLDDIGNIYTTDYFYADETDCEGLMHEIKLHGYKWNEETKELELIDNASSTESKSPKTVWHETEKEFPTMDKACVVILNKYGNVECCNMDIVVPDIVNKRFDLIKGTQCNMLIPDLWAYADDLIDLSNYTLNIYACFDTIDMKSIVMACGKDLDDAYDEYRKCSNTSLNSGNFPKRKWFKMGDKKIGGEPRVLINDTFLN